tara:strand:+ start:1261 stop:1563 length:303 start_codon:yes stop_codon:yes gene_type:complete
MLEMNAYITAKEVKIHDRYTGDSKWVLFEFEGHGYIGQLVTSFMNKVYEFVPVTETAYEVMDDDATGLWLPEFEGVFSCRCIDMEEESARGMRELMQEFS